MPFRAVKKKYKKKRAHKYDTVQNTHKEKPLQTTDFSKTPTSLISGTPHFSCGFTQLLCGTNSPDKHPPWNPHHPILYNRKGSVPAWMQFPVFPQTGAMDDIWSNFVHIKCHGLCDHCRTGKLRRERNRVSSAVCLSSTLGFNSSLWQEVSGLQMQMSYPYRLAWQMVSTLGYIIWTGAHCSGVDG